MEKRQDLAPANDATLFNVVEPTSPVDSLYYDPLIDAGEYAPGDFEPDLSFFLDPNFQRLTDDERVIFAKYDLSTVYQERYAVGFGGVHNQNPTNALFGRTKDAFASFLEIIKGETERAVFNIEGGVRDVDLSLTDEHIFEIFSEVGMMQALAQRAGIRVRSAEPFAGLSFLAKKHGAISVLHYLTYRLRPQWEKLDPTGRPPFKSYVVNIFRSRPYLSRLRHLDWVDGYIQQLAFYGTPDDLPYGGPVPNGEECLKQTTLEYIIKIDTDQRTPVQTVAYEDITD